MCPVERRSSATSCLFEGCEKAFVKFVVGEAFVGVLTAMSSQSWAVCGAILCEAGGSEGRLMAC